MQDAVLARMRACPKLILVHLIVFHALSQDPQQDFAF